METSRVRADHFLNEQLAAAADAVVQTGCRNISNNVTTGYPEAAPELTLR